MPAFIAPILGWITGPFFTFLKGLPRWVWIAILAVLTGKYLYEKGKGDGKNIGKEKVEDVKEQIKQHTKKTETIIEEAEEAVEEIEKQIYDGGEYTTDDLNRRERDRVQQLAKNDPNNVGRRVRDEAD